MVDGQQTGVVGKGFLVLLAVHRDDTGGTARRLADKTAGLRIFNDAHGKMNLSLKDTGGEALVVSQFTLYADTLKGNRPGFAQAACGSKARKHYDEYIARLQNILGADRVATGVFAAQMSVELINDGPVTICLEIPPPEHGTDRIPGMKPEPPY